LKTTILRRRAQSRPIAAAIVVAGEVVDFVTREVLEDNLRTRIGTSTMLKRFRTR